MLLQMYPALLLCSIALHNHCTVMHCIGRWKCSPAAQPPGSQLPTCCFLFTLVYQHPNMICGSEEFNVPVGSLWPKPCGLLWCAPGGWLDHITPHVQTPALHIGIWRSATQQHTGDQYSQITAFAAYAVGLLASGPRRLWHCLKLTI